MLHTDVVHDWKCNEAELIPVIKANTMELLVIIVVAEVND